MHFPELGISSEERSGLSTKADYDALLGRYAATTPEREADAIREVGKLSSQAPSVLICSEADPSRCHRSRLAEIVSRHTGLPIRHVGSAA